MARRLVAVRDDVPIDENMTWIPQAPDLQQWRELCDQYEFRQLAGSLQGMENPQTKTQTETEPPRAKYECINDLQKLRRLAMLAEKNGKLAIDTETVGQPVMAAKIVGFSVAVNADDAYYVPLAHKDDAPQLDIKEALAVIRAPLENPAIVKITHNGKYDTHVFANYGIHLAGVVEDTKIAAYVADSSSANDLKSLAMRHLGVQTTSFRDIVDGKTVKISARRIFPPPPRYAGEDAEITWKLKTAVIDKLQDKAAHIYEKIDRPLMPIFGRHGAHRHFN